MAAGVLAVAVLSAVAGAVVGSRLRSPADAARDRAAPVASRLTVPVERRPLSASLTLSGEIDFAEPVPIRLAGAVGIDAGDIAVITRLPQLDQEVVEGDVVVEVSGRPVIVLEGSFPMYRSLALGSEGPDVLQLEEALERLGHPPGDVDGVFDEATAGAVDGLYAAAGHRSVGPSDDELDRLRQLREAVTSAEDNVRRAEADLASASEAVSGAQLLALEQSVAQARDAVTATQRQVSRSNVAAAEAVDSAASAHHVAAIARDARRERRDASIVPGAIDPETGEPYTADEVNAREAELAAAEQEVVAAASALAAAQAEQVNVAELGTAENRNAVDSRALAEAQLADARRPADTTLAVRARDEATAALEVARTERDRVAASTGTRVPAGEVVFAPTLPSTVTGIDAGVGRAPGEVLATLSSAETRVVGRVARADGALVDVGADVTIVLRDTGAEFAGRVVSVGAPSDTDAGAGGSSSGGSGRLAVVVEPLDAPALREFVYSSVRIIIDIAATEEAVLVVPVAALSVGGDGRSRVEIEREPITAEHSGSTEMVEVEVGLTAQGLVEVDPVDDGLVEGDRVVVGTESRSSGPAGATDGTDGTDGTDAGDGEGSGG